MCGHVKKILVYYCVSRPFGLKWWFWLSSIGVFMTGSLSIKFVGLFVVIFVGIRAIAELWDILGDLSFPVVISPLIQFIDY